MIPFIQIFDKKKETFSTFPSLLSPSMETETKRKQLLLQLNVTFGLTSMFSCSFASVNLWISFCFDYFVFFFLFPCFPTSIQALHSIFLHFSNGKFVLCTISILDSCSFLFFYQQKNWCFFSNAKKHFVWRSQQKW